MAISYNPTNGISGTTLSYVNGTTTWANPNAKFNDGTDAVMVIPHGSKTVEITEAATLDIKGNVKINGVDLEERLSTIETVLCIPTRDVILESKYPKLKEIYNQYKHELEKYQTWERIKGNDNGTT